MHIDTIGTKRRQPIYMKRYHNRHDLITNNFLYNICIKQACSFTHVICVIKVLLYGQYVRVSH